MACNPTESQVRSEQRGEYTAMSHMTFDALANFAATLVGTIEHLSDRLAKLEARDAQAAKPKRRSPRNKTQTETIVE